MSKLDEIKKGADIVNVVVTTVLAVVDSRRKAREEAEKNAAEARKKADAEKTEREKAAAGKGGAA